MRRRIVFSLIFAAGFALSAHYFYLFLLDSQLTLLRLYEFKPLAGSIVFSILLLLFSFFFRSLTSSLLVNVIKPAKIKTLFKALVIGFFCNAVLPFRIGELVRAYVLGKDLSVSRTVMFFTVLIERMLDCLILSLFSILLMVLGHLNGVPIHSNLYSITVMVFMLGVCVLYVLFLFHQQNEWLLKAVYRFTNMFNHKIRDRLRNIIWSAIYGMNIIVKGAPLGRYLLMSVLMWCFYLGAVVVLVKAIFSVTFLESLLTANSSYLSVSVPSGSGYIGTFHYYFSNIISEFLVPTDLIGSFSLLVWMIFVIPIALVGLWAFVIYGESYKGGMDMLPYSDPKLNKLYREKDISSELSHFLDAYFSCSKLSQIVHRYEIEGTYKLITIFKGGSNAVTLLLSDNEGNRFVRKIILSQYAQKLKNQFQWLTERKSLTHFPRLVQDVTENDSYFYDQEYFKELVPFFDFIHTNTTETNQEVLELILEFVMEFIHVKKELVDSPEVLEYYIETKILNKIKDTASMNDTIAALIEYDTLLVNGHEYDNLLVVLDKIRFNKDITRDLSHYNRSPIHGDLTVDNILAAKDEFILLDSNDENYVSDPLVDFAKLYQSLHSGYEFLCLLKKVTVKGNEINFDENISSKYTQLFDYLVSRLKKDIPAERLEAIIFHEAVHFCRLLTYRARINPDTLPAFYAVATRLFNQYRASY